MKKQPWEPKTIPEMVDEMLEEAVRLCKGDKEEACRLLVDLGNKHDFMAQALFLWHLERIATE